jgi:hypothetical protein
VAVRLDFFARQGGSAFDAAALAALCGRTDALPAFLEACLAVLEEAASRPELSACRDDLAALCGLARAALAGDCDDRPVNARLAAMEFRPGAEGFALMVPGRVVWLAAMAAQVPEEEGAAAAMLVNDLAAAGAELPGRAVERAAGRKSSFL